MDLQQYFEHFKQSAVWANMVKTVEASPWHRESNVAVHTEMCVEQYLSRFWDKRVYKQNKIAVLALMFHDAGKPAAEETLEKKDGSGTYRRYAGHEQDSAVTFTECWLSDPLLRELLTAEEARMVRFIIEHHLPYGLKDGKKRSDLRTAIEHTLPGMVDTFYDCLRSDAAGRISDDHETKLQNVEDWIAEFRAAPLTINRVDSTRGNCYMLIGPSGSGKTTWVDAHRHASTRLVSMDTYRLAFFYKMVPCSVEKLGQTIGPNEMKQIYGDAFAYCCANEKEFNAYKAEQIKGAFHYARHGGAVDIFVDNTNGSKKTRASYIQAARNIGMKVVAVEFWNTFETLMERQSTRSDKMVPESSLRQQYYAQTCCLKGSEVDEVILITPT